MAASQLRVISMVVMVIQAVIWEGRNLIHFAEAGVVYYPPCVDIMWGRLAVCLTIGWDSQWPSPLTGVWTMLSLYHEVIVGYSVWRQDGWYEWSPYVCNSHHSPRSPDTGISCLGIAWANSYRVQNAYIASLLDWNGGIAKSKAPHLSNIACSLLWCGSY